MSFGKSMFTVSSNSSKLAISFLLAVVVNTPITSPSWSVTWCFLKPKWYFPLFFSQVPSLSTLSAYSFFTAISSSVRSSVTLWFVFPFGRSGVSTTLASTIIPFLTMMLCASNCALIELNNFSKVLVWVNAVLNLLTVLWSGATLQKTHFK